MSTESALAVPAELSVGGRVRLARIAAGLSVQAMADLLEMSKGTYERIEGGGRRPRRGELIAIAQLTGQELEFFGASLDDEVPTLPLLPGAVKLEDDQLKVLGKRKKT